MRLSRSSERARLQVTIGDLGEVNPYRPRVEDAEHLDLGWYVTPAFPVEGCDCGLCAAGREGRDYYLGSTARTAHIRAIQAVVRHERAAA